MGMEIMRSEKKVSSGSFPYASVDPSCNNSHRLTKNSLELMSLPIQANLAYYISPHNDFVYVNWRTFISKSALVCQAEVIRFFTEGRI